PRKPAIIATDGLGGSRRSRGDVWERHAEELAVWPASRLIIRLDAWGCYRPDHEIGREYTRPDGTKDKLGAQKTVRGRLTQALFVRHFQYHGRSSVIGLHAASADNLALWGGVDIDWHGPESTTPGVNLQGALWWYQELVRRGFRPLLSTSNGRGGYHLRVLFASPIPAERLFHFLRSLTANHRQLGLPAPPEHFPKQPDVR